MSQHHKWCLYGPTCPQEVFLRSEVDTWTVLGIFSYVLDLPTPPSSPRHLSELPPCQMPRWLCPPRKSKTGDWLYDRGSSTHCWEGLQSQGRWSWPCCCKFLAISPVLSLDLLLTTGFSCHKSEYHVLKKKKKEEAKCYIILEKSIYSLISKRSIILTNSLVLMTQISHRTHKKGIP